MGENKIKLAIRPSPFITFILVKTPYSNFYLTASIAESYVAGNINPLGI
jgi:hypothetical protein